MSYCGLVSRLAPCLCSKRVAKAEQLGRVHRGRKDLGNEVEIARDEMESLHTAATLMRSHPEYLAPRQMVDAVSAIVKHDLAILRCNS